MSNSLKKAPQENPALVQNRDMLISAISDEAEYLKNLTKRVDPAIFKSAVEELAGNSYLMETIPVNQIVRVAGQAASMGLSVNPYSKHCHVIPFNVKGRGMVASLVVSKKGVQEIAHQSEFFLKVDGVWRINGKATKESEMDIEDRSDLDETNPQYFNKNFLGWFFTLTDVSNGDVKVQEQEEFVALKTAIALTKKMDAPDHSLKQAYVHKAIRRALTEFFIPSGRSTEFTQLVKIDDENAIEVEVVEKEKPALSAAPQSDTKEVTAVLTQIGIANTELDMGPIHTTIAAMDASEGKTKLIAAYRDRLKTLRDNPALPDSKSAEKPAPKKAKTAGPTFAVINQSINDAKSAGDVDAAIADLSHLPADQQAELRTSAENQKHALSQ